MLQFLIVSKELLNAFENRILLWVIGMLLGGNLENNGERLRVLLVFDRFPNQFGNLSIGI